MRGYTKADIEFHNDGGIGRPYYPAVNVKCYRFGPSLEAVADRFGCSEGTAQKALNIAFECQQDSFWNFDGAKDIVEYHFPYAKFYSAGRSAGWLIVEGLSDADTWDAIELNKWALFECTVKREIEYLCSDENVLELIEINRWAEDTQALESAIGEALD